VADDIWDNFFVPFQRFLWYADEMEHRWHTLKLIVYDEVSYTTKDTETQGGRRQGWGRPRFYDVTWSHGAELLKEVDELRKQLGCTPQATVEHLHSHVEHKQRNLNCSKQILQDLEYRKLMNYDSKTLEILVSSDVPQHVDSKECIETRTELEQAIKTYTDVEGIAFDESEWVLPTVNAYLP
jgi:hypothetical protein